MIATSSVIQFELPEHLACPKPTELRNIARDGVQLLVTTGTGEVHHDVFNQLDSYLKKGDVLVVNTSATRPSAIPVKLQDGRKGMVHLSTKINSREWLLEIREVKGNKTIRWKDGHEQMKFELPHDGVVTLKKRFYEDRELLNLWVADFNTTLEYGTYLNQYAQPIKYDKLNEQYPLDFYQTFFSFHPGSAEMPSAGRGFTQTLVDKLLNKGILFASVLLHSGVSSLEENEAPYSEYMEMNPISASIINSAKNEGRRIIAIGTTAVRAIESAVNDEDGVIPYRGKTDLFINEDYEMKIVSGLITGFHEPRSSHLYMLQSLAGFSHIEHSYQVAINKNYYWHQFGDLHLILP